MEATTMTPEQPTPQVKARRTPVPLNGVDTPALLATLDAVKAAPELARFRFRATNRWQQGTHSRSTFETFDGAGGPQRHQRAFTSDADHPSVLVGRDHAPTPVEYLLHALAADITAGIGNIAAARGVTLYEVESTVEGDLDVHGILGQPAEERNGYERLRASFKIKGDATPEVLRAIVDQSRECSAVYDVLTRGVPVMIGVDAG